MPRLRWTLTHREQAEYKRILERLRAAGADVDLSTLEATDKPWLSLKCCPEGSSVRTMPAACVFVIYIRIVALAPKVVLQDFDVSSPDWPLNAYMLGDPSVRRSSDQFYLLLDRTKMYRDEVLNHRIDAEGILRRGDVLEGVLLAQSLNPVPARYTKGSLMRLCLTVMNQFDEFQKFTVEIPVEHIPAPVYPQTTCHGNLYDVGKESVGCWSPGDVPNAVPDGMPNRSGPGHGQGAKSIRRRWAGTRRETTDEVGARAHRRWKSRSQRQGSSPPDSTRVVAS